MNFTKVSIKTEHPMCVPSSGAPIHLGIRTSADGKVSRSDLWSLRYRVQPYLQYLSFAELDSRWCDVMANHFVIDAQGRLSGEAEELTRDGSWTELFAGVMEEYGRRGTGMPGGLIREAEQMPRTTAPLPAKGHRELSSLSWDARNALLKFGSRSWLKETYETGRWRIASATGYASASHCSARKDNEMFFVGNFPSFTKTEELSFDERTKPDRLEKVTRIELESVSNYYLVCMARGISYRMFDDFRADSCIVVRDETVFLLRMLGAFRKVRRDFFCKFSSVEYLDPYLLDHTAEIQFAKDFRYAYQREARFVWPPKRPVFSLENFFIDLGPLSDCCDYIELS